MLKSLLFSLSLYFYSANALCPAPTNYISKPLSVYSSEKESPIYYAPLSLILVRCRNNQAVLAICEGSEFRWISRCPDDVNYNNNNNNNNSGDGSGSGNSKSDSSRYNSNKPTPINDRSSLLKPSKRFFCPNPYNYVGNATILCVRVHCDTWELRSVVHIRCNNRKILSNKVLRLEQLYYRSTCVFDRLSDSPTAYWSPPLPKCDSLAEAAGGGGINGAGENKGLTNSPNHMDNLLSEVSVRWNMKMMLLTFATISLFVISLICLLIARYLNNRAENSYRRGSSRSSGTTNVGSGGGPSSRIVGVESLFSNNNQRRLLLSPSQSQVGGEGGQAVNISTEPVPGLPTYDEVIKQLHFQERRYLLSNQIVGYPPPPPPPPVQSVSILCENSQLLSSPPDSPPPQYCEREQLSDGLSIHSNETNIEQTTPPQQQQQLSTTTTTSPSSSNATV